MGAANHTASHSVAVTGLSCRFPGDGDTLDTFWESICAGKCKPSVPNQHPAPVRSRADPGLQRHGQRFQRSALILMPSGHKKRTAILAQPKVPIF